MMMNQKHKQLIRKTLPGFSFFEVLLYLGIFSIMATALFTFSWDVIRLGTKERIGQQVFAEGRFVSERLKYFIRNSDGIDIDASRLGDTDGKIVLKKRGSSDRITIDIQNGHIVLGETGKADVKLTSDVTSVTALTFTPYGSREDASQYVDFTLVLGLGSSGARAEYSTTMTIQSGVFIRNSGL